MDAAKRVGARRSIRDWMAYGTVFQSGVCFALTARVA